MKNNCVIQIYPGSGARVGAGRPSKARANYTFYLEPKVVDAAKKLKRNVSLNDYINNSISHFNKFNLEKNTLTS